MYAYALNRSTRSTEVEVAPGALFTAESQAIVRTSGSTSLGCLPSTGTSNDIFAGFAIAGTAGAPFAEPYANNVEQFVVPSGGSVTLQFTPVSGQVAVFDNTTSAPISSPTVTGNVVSGLTAGDTVTVTYKYALTVFQQQALYGNVAPGGYSGSYVGQIGCIQSGQVYVSEFDASVNWAAATGVKLNANGQVTNQSGSGVAISAVVIAIPSITYPYLGLEFNAAV